MAVHLRILLILTGLTGIHSITTVSEVSVKARGSISIPCLYDLQYRGHVKYLCKGYYWTSCSYAVKTSQQRSGRFSISDDKTEGIFTVTIKDLMAQDTDYWCAVEINGGSDVRRYFHLSVTRGVPSLYVEHQEVTGVKEDNITINCYHHNSGEMKWCRLGSSCVMGSSGSIQGTKVTIDTSVSNVFTVTMSGLKTESSGWYWCVKGHLQMPVNVTVTEKPTTTTFSTTTHLTTTSSTPEPVILTTGFAEKDQTTAQAEQHQHRKSVDLKSLIILLSSLIFVLMVILFIWLMLKKHKQSGAAAAAAMTATEEEVAHTTIALERKTPRLTHNESDVDVLYSSVAVKQNGVRKTHNESDVDVLYSSVVIKQNGVRKVNANDDNVIYSTLA